MTLKLKILRCIRFIMQEFDLDQSHLFTLLHEEIEDEHLEIERCWIENNIKVQQ